MEGTLRIAVTLLGNRFHGEEWPSSPSRLFRALMAGAMTGGYRDQWSTVEPALRWLEKQAAPEIDAVAAESENSYRIAVPNNDMDIAAKEWRAGRTFDVSVLRTMKPVNPYSLPGEGPHLIYKWRTVGMDEPLLAGLRTATDCLHTLGWGIDAAFAQLDFGDVGDATVGQVRWRPVERGGRYLTLPTEGSLDDLQESYRRFLSAVTKSDVNPDTRPMVFRQARYGNGIPQRECIHFDLQTIEGDGRLSLAPEKTMHLAAWMRHAVSQALLKEGYPEGWVNAEALGHGTAEARLSYVPMASVGHQYVHGRIQRVMVTQESGGDTEVMKFLRKKLTGSVLTDQGGQEKCRLVAPLDDRVRPFYLQKSRNWRTVTPVVLHGFNSQRGVISLKKTDRLLGHAFANAGWDLNKIERIAFQSAPFFRGVEGSKRMIVPKHLQRWPRYHVAVDFREDVAGPLLVGLGKHYGIGVFASVR